ncbi:MAG: response regulator [Patescibacteria group bacterium]
MKKILIVEDDPGLLESFQKAFSGRPYELIQAMDGEQGLARMRAEKPDMVLLDLLLPKKHGFEVLEEMRNDAALKQMPVMVLTNLENAEDVEKALELGATTYLVKANYTLEEIAQKVEEVLESRK